MDTYQAVYDAARSKMSNGDIGAAVESAVREMNLSHYIDAACQRVQLAADECARPSAVYRPSVFVDGDQWCALYGDNLQDGVAGFGDSVEAAMQDFDTRWYAPIQPPVEQEGKPHHRSSEQCAT